MSFWANVTGTATVMPPRPDTSVYPQAVPNYPAMPQGYPQVPQTPVHQPVEDEDLERHRRKAPSSRSKLICPNCFSGNVCKPTPNTMEQCYECGWNPRFEQTTGGVATPGEAPQAARQISTANNFNPQTIVATVVG